jgi:hypothetical protein
MKRSGRGNFEEKRHICFEGVYISYFWLWLPARKKAKKKKNTKQKPFSSSNCNVNITLISITSSSLLIHNIYAHSQPLDGCMDSKQPPTLNAIVVLALGTRGDVQPLASKYLYINV